MKSTCVKLNEELQESLTNKYACYVLITCEEPSEDGEMNVQMSYEGDSTLASLLIDGAQAMMDAQHES